MRILVVSDIESDILLKYYKENSLDETDVILSVGDLPYSYLKTIKDNLNKPLYYVKGNHDKFNTSIFNREFIEWKCIEFNGIVIAGIGCISKRGQIMSEKEMEDKLNIIYKKINDFGKVDIIISHYPALDVGDGDDKMHKGYKAINDLIKKTRPKYFIHGHNHLNYGRNNRIYNDGNTVFINAYEKYVYEY